MNYFCIILQAKEEMKAAKTVYEGINNELKEEQQEIPQKAICENTSVPGVHNKGNCTHVWK